jgi:hypothetical protein
MVVAWLRRPSQHHGLARTTRCLTAVVRQSATVRRHSPAATIHLVSWRESTLEPHKTRHRRERHNSQRHVLTKGSTATAFNCKLKKPHQLGTSRLKQTRIHTATAQRARKNSLAVYSPPCKLGVWTSTDRTYMLQTISQTTDKRQTIKIMKEIMGRMEVEGSGTTLQIHSRRITPVQWRVYGDSCSCP